MPLVLERLCAVVVRRKEFASRLENRRVRGRTKYKVFDPVDATKYKWPQLEHHLLLDPLAFLLQILLSNVYLRPLFPHL